MGDADDVADLVLPEQQRGQPPRRSPSAVDVDRDPQAGGDSVDPARILAGKELGERLKAALDALPEKQKMAILLFTIEQMPQKQVAEALECSVEAVKWHVFQGRKKLKDILKEHL